MTVRLQASKICPHRDSEIDTIMHSLSNDISSDCSRISDEINSTKLVDALYSTFSRQSNLSSELDASILSQYSKNFHRVDLLEWFELVQIACAWQSDSLTTQDMQLAWQRLLKDDYRPPGIL